MGSDGDPRRSHADMLGCAQTANSNIYTLTKFQYPEQKWTMVFYNKEVAITCSCKMMESAGIPCRHIFHVVKFEQLVRIPLTLILGRWTKLAKVSKVMKMTAVTSHLDKEVLKTTEFGSLSAACTNRCLFAVKNEQSYMIALDEIQRTCLLYPSKDMQPNDLHYSVGSTGCVSADDQPRHCSYNVLTPPVLMESGSPSSPTFAFETTCPWRHDISEGIDGHYDNSNTFGITYETNANTYYNWWPHNNL